MIALTRLNGSRFVLNSDLIQTIESSPDTTVTLVNGEKLLVREPADEVCDLTIAFRCQLLCRAGGSLQTTSLASSASTWQASMPGASARPFHNRAQGCQQDEEDFAEEDDEDASD